jgi:hypothetical protein
MASGLAEVLGAITRLMDRLVAREPLIDLYTPSGTYIKVNTTRGALQIPKELALLFHSYFN